LALRRGPEKEIFWGDPPAATSTAKVEGTALASTKEQLRAHNPQAVPSNSGKRSDGFSRSYMPFAEEDENSRIFRRVGCRTNLRKRRGPSRLAAREPDFWVHPKQTLRRRYAPASGLGEASQ